MSKSHQKKRNSGLLYEFLVQVISKSLVDGNNRASRAALKILKRHFKPGTELYKELRLLNSLVKTKVSSEAVAASIIQEAKTAARSHDPVALDRQKSLLIRDINHTINDEDFYDQHVNEYKVLATIQSLFNDWRKPPPDISKMATYEDQLLKYLISERVQPADVKMSDDSPGTSRLLMKVMMRKLNEKYSGILNNEQKALVKAYAFSAASDNDASIRLKLQETKRDILESIDQLEREGDSSLTKKLADVKSRVLTEDLEKIDDETVTRFMLYTQLKSEIDSEETDDA